MAKKSWLDLANACPPVFCRIVARTGRGHTCRPLTIEEICERSGLRPTQVKVISKLTRWDKMPAKNIEAFAHGCGVDLLRTKEHRRYLKHRHLTHLDNATPTQRASIMALVKIFRRALQGPVELPSVCDHC